MAALSGIQESMALGEEARAQRERDREQVKHRLVMMARQRAPLPLDVERSARKLSLTPGQLRKRLGELVAAGQIEERANGYYATLPVKTHAPDRSRPVRQKPPARDPRKPTPRERPSKPAGLQLAGPERAVVDVLLADGPMPRDQLRAAARVSDSVITSLAARSVVQSRHGRVALTIAALQELTADAGS